MLSISSASSCLLVAGAGVLQRAGAGVLVQQERAGAGDLLAHSPQGAGAGGRRGGRVQRRGRGGQAPSLGSKE